MSIAFFVRLRSYNLRNSAAAGMFIQYGLNILLWHNKITLANVGVEIILVNNIISINYPNIFSVELIH